MKTKKNTKPTTAKNKGKSGGVKKAGAKNKPKNSVLGKTLLGSPGDIFKSRAFKKK